MYWRNGYEISTVSVTDRSFQYGDGCFTTILTRHGKLENWPLHVERLELALTTLNIAFPNWHLLERELVTHALSQERAGLKIHISRGEGGRGYSPLGLTPLITISAFSYPSHYQQWQSEGVVLGICERRLGINPLLAGLKHNNRLEQILLKDELESHGFNDGIALNLDGHVIETTMANLFWVTDGSLYTPALTLSGVSGVMRKCVLQQAEHIGYQVVVGDFQLDSLYEAQELFICNSLLGVAPVTQIAGTSFKIGTITRNIQERLGQW